MTEVANTPNWAVLGDPDVMQAIDTAARIVSSRYRDRAVNMLAEYDDLRQEALILAATRTQLQGLDRRLLQFRLVQDLNDLVRGAAERANNTIYQSALEAA